MANIVLIALLLLERLQRLDFARYENEELLKIPDLGPRKAVRIHQELVIENLDELKKAAKEEKRRFYLDDPRKGSRCSS